jgi:ABC-type glycerol-3-phosphate transport system substrate-binding protein
LNNYHACTDINGGSPSKDVLTKKDGRWAVLRAMEKLITPDYVVDGAAAEDHITMQTKFLNTDIGMMVNGNWLTKEMSEVGSTDNFGLMKTPVISEITENLMTISDDETLRTVIDAIDEVIDDESKISKYKSGDDYVVDGQTISAIDWDYVMAARTTSPVGFSTAFIPKYSNAVDGAKEFLKFLCSDKGMEIYLKYTHISMPLEFSDGREFDTSDWNTLEKESDEVLRNTVYYATNTMLNRHPIFRAGGASSYVGVSVPQMMYTKNPADRMSAEDVWTEMMRILEMKYEKDWLFNIK